MALKISSRERDPEYTREFDIGFPLLDEGSAAL
jgi:hypothetical protein